MVEIGYDSSEDASKVYWSEVDSPIFTNYYYQPDKPRSRWNYPFTQTPYSVRSYRLFSKLADVRNGSSSSPSLLQAMLNGFGSQNLERDAIQPLDQPRGIPEDASDGWKKYVESWGGNMHSHSYFTLEELEQARANGLFEDTIIQRGWITLEQYIEMRETGETPSSWAGGVGGGGVVHMDFEEVSKKSIEELKSIAEEYSANREAEDVISGRVYVNAEWEATYGEETYAEFFRAMEEMRELLVNENTPANRVRLVFGFDS